MSFIVHSSTLVCLPLFLLFLSYLNRQGTVELGLELSAGGQQQAARQPHARSQHSEQVRFAIAVASPL